jgi:ATP-dependent DNA helicase RecG
MGCDLDYINKLLQAGESQTVEFKSSFDGETIEALVAFTNTFGGVVLVGVADNGCLKGIALGKETLNDWLSQIKSSTSPAIIPDIESVVIDDKSIAVISIPSFPVKPVAFKGRYYKRVASSNQRMTLSEISDMYLQTFQISWDSHPHQEADLNDLDTVKIERFIEKVNNNGRFRLDETVLDALEKLRLLRGEAPTHAAMLLFARTPLFYNIRVGRFKDDITILDDRQITATLFDALDETMNAVKAYLKLAYQFDGSIKRIEVWEYPLSALREALLNAIVHRDYTNPSDIQIKIFDDKITIYNPGKLYGNLTVHDLLLNNYQSQLRNKLVAESFYLVGNIEKYGSGIIRIHRAVAESDSISFDMEELANGFLVTFAKTTQKMVLDCLRESPRLTRTSLAIMLNKSESTIKEHLATLKKAGLIERVGSDRDGEWHVVEGEVISTDYGR